MRPATSLTNRIFLACTLLATLSLGFAFYFVNARAAAEAESELERELNDSASLVDHQRATRTDYYTRMARLVADVPKLKAAVDTNDPPTVQPLADEYLKEIAPDLFIVSDRHGRVIAAAGDRSAFFEKDETGSIEETSRFVQHPRGILQAVTVPIFLEGDPDILGRLTVGFFLDDALARQLRAETGSEIAFGVDGRILAASLPESSRAQLAPVLTATGIARVLIDGDDFLAVARPILPVPGMRAPDAPYPLVLTLRSRTARLRFLNTVRNGLVGALILTMLLATILSYAVARTMTRPLAAVTGAMRDVAATGDLTRKVVLRSRAWDDEDARLLATTFNTLTESIGRFQREAAQKDRLSSLGRLSTVVAHEIRNPLMIITATCSTLRRQGVSDADLREAIADIEGETRRLNRIVTEVLDFARPIRFALAPADVNEICRNSVAAAWAGFDRGNVRLDLDGTLPPVVTDAERLRTALVNILTNARHAVETSAAGGTAAALPLVALSTRAHGERFTIRIDDQGTGISPEDMAHIFDPYFTTRRAGTGLGLPIARNIVDGLGGTIHVHSERGGGTSIALDLPQHSAGGLE
jgi:signal transduction histidine kinase